MAHEMLMAKAATIERCVARAREEYAADPTGFASNLTRQDAAVCNIVRACDAALDVGQHLIRRERLGVPQSARDVFALLARGGWVTPALAQSLQRMVGFRNIAVHDDQTLQMPITVSIITGHLDEFLVFSREVLLKDEAATQQKFLKLRNIKSLEVVGGRISEYQKLHTRDATCHEPAPNAPGRRAAQRQRARPFGARTAQIPGAAH